MEAVGVAVGCSSLSFNILNEFRQHGNSSVQDLKVNIESGWITLKKVGELELRGIDTNEITQAIKTLNEWCYEAEDLLDNQLLIEQGSSSLMQKIMDKFRKLINPDKIKKFCERAEKRLNDLHRSYNYISAGLENNNFQRSKINHIRCFAYLALFPATHQFTIKYLVHLWIGEGFIRSEDPMSLKQVEEKYGHVLQDWLIQLQPPGDLYSIGQDIPKLSASRTCLQLGQGVWNGMTRHLSFSCNDFNKDSWSAVPKDKKLGKKLRTFLSIYNDNKNARDQQILEVPQNFWNKVSCLRVLSFKGLNIVTIPNCINDLKLLQYFDISFTLVEVLRKEFCYLQALKFLKLKNSKCSHLLKEFHKLTNLIYVDWDELTLRSVGIPCNIGKLSKLESLPLFKVGTEEGYLISELGEMNKLQGTLQIMNLQRVEKNEEAKKAMLKDKSDLTTIILEWNSNSNGSAENVLSGLELHENVKELKLIKYGGEKFPDWIKDSYLEKIHLEECRSLDSFRELGKLKYLKTLILENMESKPELSCRSSDDTQAADPLFPALESLELYNLTQLQKMTGLRTGDMPCICKFKAAGCTAIADLFADFAPRTADLGLKQVIKSIFFDQKKIIKSIFENKGWGHTLEIKIDDVKRQNGTITQFVDTIHM